VLSKLIKHIIHILTRFVKGFVQDSRKLVLEAGAECATRRLNDESWKHRITHQTTRTNALWRLAWRHLRCSIGGWLTFPIEPGVHMPSQTHSLIVGIAGGSASGKSTFTAALLEALVIQCPDSRVLVVHSDRYFRVGTPEMPTFTSPTSGETYPDYNRPDAVDVDRMVSDLDAKVRSEDAPDILIVEGHLLFAWPEVCDRLDVRLFIDLDGETRALRRLVRNLAHHGDPLVDQSAQSIATYYLESAKVGYDRYIAPSRVHADLIVRGDADFARVAPMIASVIAKELSR